MLGTDGPCSAWRSGPGMFGKYCLIKCLKKIIEGDFFAPKKGPKTKKKVASKNPKPKGKLLLSITTININIKLIVVIFLLVWDFYWRLFSLFLGPFLGAKKSPFLTPFAQPNQRENYQLIGSGLIFWGLGIIVAVSRLDFCNWPQENKQIEPLDRHGHEFKTQPQAHPTGKRCSVSSSSGNRWPPSRSAAVKAKFEVTRYPVKWNDNH